MIVRTGTYLFVRKSQFLYGDNDGTYQLIVASYRLVQVYRTPDVCDLYVIRMSFICNLYVAVCTQASSCM